MLIPTSWGEIGRALAQGAIPPGVALNPMSLIKFIDPLPIPGPMPSAGANIYNIGAYPVRQQLHSQLPMTNLWGYGTSAATASYPAATIEVLKGTAITINWTNGLSGPHPLPVDPSLHWADPDGEGMMMGPFQPGFTYTSRTIPLSTHVHGGEQEPQSDGHPDDWILPGETITYHYTNQQPPATLWYHDHALGITRLNVYMGLAGYYIVRDPGSEPAGLPSGPFEIPLVIQDRIFSTDGQLLFPALGPNPDMHPFWVPEFFGDTILVNGKVWPYLEVQPRKYRFRMLNGSNGRFYEMQFQNRGGSGPSFTQIGTDGGYLYAPATFQRLVLAPGERADVVVDFSLYRPGTRFILRNSARTPFPRGGTIDPNTLGQIMEFRVVPRVGAPDNTPLPNVLNPSLATFPSVGIPSVTRTMTLFEVMGMGGPLASLLNGTMWDAPVSEEVREGTTELWEVINITADTHPIHLHLMQVQIVNRQRFKEKEFTAAFDAANPIVPIPHDSAYVPVPVAPYLQGPALPPASNERGWKDTVRMNPGEVTRILVRVAPIEGGEYPFDATAAPGYVWHCHMLEHEDNEMMRPLRVIP